jgi:hypothetical protein
MSRQKCRFLESEVGRAVRAVEKVGKTVKRVEIDPATGKIILLVGRAEAVAASGNEWDEP